MAVGQSLTSSGFNNILQLCWNSVDTRSFTVFAIGTGVTTPTTATTGLSGTITGWAGGTADFKAYSTVTFSGAAEEVTTRAFITAAEATGNSIAEYGDLNTLGTKIPAGVFVFNDAVTKTATVQLTVITKYRRS